MGGWGSGRYDYATTPTVEECWHLDADQLKDLTEAPGTVATYRWGDKEDPSATIAVCALKEKPLDDADTRAKGLGLIYTSTDPRTEESETHAYPVHLEYTECNFGGYRPWFRCPECDDRRRKLYLPSRGGGRRFLCRECYDLGYRSSRTSGDDLKQAELRYRRAFAKADAENRRPHPNNSPFFPERPKGMHHDTFEQLEWEARLAELEWTERMRKRTNELFDHLDVDRRVPDPMGRES